MAAGRRQLESKERCTVSAGMEARRNVPSTLARWHGSTEQRDVHACSLSSVHEYRNPPAAAENPCPLCHRLGKLSA
eukprot:110367-Chlamydomonas_euryale.AAC.2